MSKSFSETQIENLKNIQLSNTKNIKFYRQDETYIKGEQKKVNAQLDAILYEFNNPEVIGIITTSLMTQALRATERTPNQYLRRQLKDLLGMCVYFNQIDNDLKNTESGRQASRNLLWMVNQAYIEVFDVHILNSRVVKDILINAIKKGTFESSLALDQLFSLMDDPDSLKKVEEATKELKKKKKKTK